MQASSHDLEEFMELARSLTGHFRPEPVVSLLREQGKHIEADTIEGLSDRLRLLEEENNTLRQQFSRRFKRRNKRRKK